MLLHLVVTCLTLIARQPAAPVSIALTEPELDVVRFLCRAAPNLMDGLSPAGQRLLKSEDSARVIMVSDEGVWQFRTNDLQLRRDEGGQKGDASTLQRALERPGIAEYLCVKRNEAAVLSGVGKREDCTLRAAVKASLRVDDERLRTALRVGLGSMISRLSADAQVDLLKDGELGDVAKLALAEHTLAKQEQLRAVVEDRGQLPRAPNRLANEVAIALSDFQFQKGLGWHIYPEGNKAVAKVETRPGVAVYLGWADRKAAEASPGEWYNAVVSGEAKVFVAKDLDTVVAIDVEAIRKTLTENRR